MPQVWCKGEEEEEAEVEIRERSRVREAGPNAII